MVLIGHGAHWISVHGVYSDVYVPGNYSGSTVYGFYVTDPLIGSSWTPYIPSANTYLLAADFMTNFFTTVSSSDDIWPGYYVSVERNANSSYNRGSYIDSSQFSHY